MCRKEESLLVGIYPRGRGGKRYVALYQGSMKGKSCELRRSGREGRTLDINSVREKAPRRADRAASKLDSELG